MNMRYETIENDFVIYGFGVKGARENIPRAWKLLAPYIDTDESYGVCRNGNRERNWYIAGIKRNIDHPDVQQETIKAGKYIVETVEGGIPGIPKTYDELFSLKNIEVINAPNFEKYIHPPGSKEDVIEIWLPVKYKQNFR